MRLKWHKSKPNICNRLPPAPEGLAFVSLPVMNLISLWTISRWVSENVSAWWMAGRYIDASKLMIWSCLSSLWNSSNFVIVIVFVRFVPCFVPSSPLLQRWMTTMCKGSLPKISGVWTFHSCLAMIELMVSREWPRTHALWRLVSYFLFLWIQLNNLLGDGGGGGGDVAVLDVGEKAKASSVFLWRGPGVLCLIVCSSSSGRSSVTLGRGLDASNICSSS